MTDDAFWLYDNPEKDWKPHFGCMWEQWRCAARAEFLSATPAPAGHQVGCPQPRHSDSSETSLNLTAGVGDDPPAKQAASAVSFGGASPQAARSGYGTTSQPTASEFATVGNK